MKNKIKQIKNKNKNYCDNKWLHGDVVDHRWHQEPHRAEA